MGGHILVQRLRDWQKESITNNCKFGLKARKFSFSLFPFVMFYCFFILGFATREAM